MVEDFWVIPGGPEAVLYTGRHESTACRLAAAFRWVLTTVAERAPEDSRTVRAYWSERKARTGGQSPCVELSGGSGRPHTLLQGHYFRLFADTVDEWRDDWLRAAVAHEVAHAVLYARQDPDHWPDPKADGRTMEGIDAARERKVGELLRSWNIDETELLRWVQERAAPRAP